MKKMVKESPVAIRRRIEHNKACASAYKNITRSGNTFTGCQITPAEYDVNSPLKELYVFSEASHGYVYDKIPLWAEYQWMKREEVHHEPLPNGGIAVYYIFDADEIETAIKRRIAALESLIERDKEKLEG